MFVPVATGGAIGVLAGGNGVPLIAQTRWRVGWATSLVRAQGQRERRSVGVAILILAAVAACGLDSSRRGATMICCF
jgi:hypothetical protein